MAKTWLIAGCSTGFSKVLARAVLVGGDNLVATARRTDDLDELVGRFPDTARAAALDVMQKGAAAAAVRVAQEAFGGLDVLVNNAGVGFVGAVEEATPDEYRPMFETNVFGLIETTRAALPALRRRGHATVVNFSSGAEADQGRGSVLRPGQGRMARRRDTVATPASRLRMGPRQPSSSEKTSDKSSPSYSSAKGISMPISGIRMAASAARMRPSQSAPTRSNTVAPTVPCSSMT